MIERKKCLVDKQTAFPILISKVKVFKSEKQIVGLFRSYF